MIPQERIGIMITMPKTAFSSLIAVMAEIITDIGIIGLAWEIVTTFLAEM
jgi:hypothetical protein